MSGPNAAPDSAGPSLALAAYLALSRAAGPLAPWLLARRAARGREDPARIGERLGRPGLPRPDGPLIWLHAASVGEALSALPLIDALAGAASVLLTTGTVTSARLVAGRLPPGARHQFVPVDTGAAVTGFLDHWRPDLGIWIESELWPRLVIETARRGVPMLMVNARISARSAAGWARAPRMAARLVRSFAEIVTQDADSAARLNAMGAARVRVGGNLKLLAPPPPADPAALAAASAALGPRPRWLAASTHGPEEAAAARAHLSLRAAHPGLCTLIAPRHPDRGEALAAELAALGLDIGRRSLGQGPGADIWLLDSFGEMGLWYRLAPVSLVGGSLVDRGGHNPFEPAALGSAILHGPHVANFAPAYAALAAAGGARAVTADSLGPGVAALLADTPARAAMTAAAVAAVDAPDLAALVATVRRLAGLAP